MNVPDVPFKDLRGIELTRVGFRHYSEEVHARTDSRGRPYYWIAGLYEGFTPGDDSDCAVVEALKVSVTPHTLVGGHNPDWSALKEVLKQVSWV